MQLKENDLSVWVTPFLFNIVKKQVQNINFISLQCPRIYIFGSSCMILILCRQMFYFNPKLLGGKRN